MGIQYGSGKWTVFVTPLPTPFLHSFVGSQINLAQPQRTAALQRCVIQCAVPRPCVAEVDLLVSALCFAAPCLWLSSPRPHISWRRTKGRQCIIQGHCMDDVNRMVIGTAVLM